MESSFRNTAQRYVNMYVNIAKKRSVRNGEKTRWEMSADDCLHQVWGLLMEKKPTYEELEQRIKDFEKEVAERERVEVALLESEEKLRILSDQALMGIIILRGELFVYVNDRSAEIMEVSAEEIAKWSSGDYAKLIHPDDLAFVMEQGRKKQAGKKDAVIHYNWRMVTPGGNLKWIEMWSKTILFAGGAADMVTMIDITERVSAEEALRESEEKLARSRKMESLGLMAGGVAHDLNNILSGIVSYPELLLMEIPEDSSLRKPLKTIQESGMRAADVVEELLTVARGVAMGKEVLNLNTLITEYLGSAEYLQLEKTCSFIDFKAELDPDLMNISGSSTHIKKILMNLVNNASEAIDGSGAVTISTTNLCLYEPIEEYENMAIGEYSVLRVSDNGTGISPEDLERIFEPFYTKKVMGRRSGTGLGLAVVWNTVQDHQGYIDVKSDDKGTVFELYFPVTRDEVIAAGGEGSLADYLGHGEKILVVDDEERQREITCRILTKLGYMPEAVSSGEAAIEYVKQTPVDLIVLDMDMPRGINGCQTYEEIIGIQPKQKAIIASGYAKTREVGIAQRLGAGRYIKKPYTLEKIGAVVKEELEK
jgi:two-component system, cell cycle sensor histidine kinase and response regulator CckA